MQTIENILKGALIFALIEFTFYYEINLGIFRMVFSQLLNLRRNTWNVKVKSTRNTCFSSERKSLAPRIYQAKFLLPIP